MCRRDRRRWHRYGGGRGGRRRRDSGHCSGSRLRGRSGSGLSFRWFHGCLSHWSGSSRGCGRFLPATRRWSGSSRGCGRFLPATARINAPMMEHIVQTFIANHLKIVKGSRYSKLYHCGYCQAFVLHVSGRVQSLDNGIRIQQGRCTAL